MHFHSWDSVHLEWDCLLPVVVELDLQEFEQETVKLEHFVKKYLDVRCYEMKDCLQQELLQNW